MNQKYLLLLVCLPRQMYLQQHCRRWASKETTLPIFQTFRRNHALMTCLIPIGQAIQEILDLTSAEILDLTSARTLQGICKTCTWWERERKTKNGELLQRRPIILCSAPWVATTVAWPVPAPVARGPHGPPNHCY